MENGHNCPYGQELDKPINGSCTYAADGFITRNNRYPCQAK